VNESDFEGSIVLEKLARIDSVDAFVSAVDSEDYEKVVELMETANIDHSEFVKVADKVLKKTSKEPTMLSIH